MPTTTNSTVETRRNADAGIANATTGSCPPALIRALGLSLSFAGRSGLFKKDSIHAVKDVSFEIAQGTTLGLVGESGCGKSTVGRMSVGLLTPDSGEVFIQDSALYSGKKRGSILRSAGLTGKLQMIFQDPHSSLNPRMRIGESVAEPLICLGVARDECDLRVAEILDMVGLSKDQARRYPHEFSGGQRQRIAIARALVTRPFFVVCDEPTSSLDASVQAQILNLLKDMQSCFGLTFMFISHDLAVVRHVSDYTAVMYAGLIVEIGPSEDIFTSPGHPYSRLLLSSVPGAPPCRESSDPRRLKAGSSHSPRQCHDNSLAKTQFQSQATTSSSSANVTAGMRGCPFAPRCPQVLPICLQELPALEAFGSTAQTQRQLRCHIK